MTQISQGAHNRPAVDPGPVQVPNFVPGDSETTVITSGMARWSDPSTWGGSVPNQNSVAVIGPGCTVVLDESITVGGIIVSGGELLVEDGVNLTINLAADFILVNNGGLFQAGTESNPLDTNLTVTLEGDNPNFDLVVNNDVVNGNANNTLFASPGTTSSPGGSTGNPVVTLRKANASDFAIDGGPGGAIGQNVYLWNFGPSNINIRFVEVGRGNGFFSYAKFNTNFALDGGAGGARAQNVYLWTNGPNNFNQQWRKVSIGGNRYQLQKRNALEFSIDGGASGQRLQNVYLWNSGSNNLNQQWIIEND